ncbi:MAG: 50S ribosomal protein L25 [Candidatus Omnitrophica bacterium]|nr:50S ribosomal protein L25 [Candidatus Omnitrophota bacterium]
MERVKIKVSNREGKGKEIVKRLKKEGFVPAVVYSSDMNATLTVPVESLKILRAIHFSESTVIDMQIEGGKESVSLPVLIKDVQFNPVTETPIHIDFLKVSLTEKIKVEIPIILKGESKQVKEENGVIEQILRELEVEGLPLDIPEHIDLDISGLEIGKSIHVESLAVSDKLKLITDPQATIVTALAKKEEVEEEPLVEAAPPGEPEVIKEKKEAAGDQSKEGKKEDKEDKEKK